MDFRYVMISVAVFAVFIIAASADGYRRVPFSLEETYKFVGSDISPRWVTDTVIEYHDNSSGHVISYDVVRNETGILLDSSILNRLHYNSYKFSSDGKYVLIEYGKTKDMNESQHWVAVSRYVVYSIDTRTFIDIDKKSYIQYAAWFPGRNSIVYIKKNNIYRLDLKQRLATQKITEDGEPGLIYNGLCDLLYKDEVMLQFHTIRISPDGTQLIYLAIDAREMGMMIIPIYSTPGKIEHQYPRQNKFPYSKPGTPISKFVVWHVNFTAGTIKPVAQSSEGREISYQMEWVSNNLVQLVFANRVQNETVVELCNLDSSREVYPCRKVSEDKNRRGWANTNKLYFSKDAERYLVRNRVRVGRTGYYHLQVIYKNGSRTDLTPGSFMVSDVNAWDEDKRIVMYCESCWDSYGNPGGGDVPAGDRGIRSGTSADDRINDLTTWNSSELTQTITPLGNFNACLHSTRKMDGAPSADDLSRVDPSLPMSPFVHEAGNLVRQRTQLETAVVRDARNHEKWTYSRVFSGYLSGVFVVRTPAKSGTLFASGILHPYFNSPIPDKPSTNHVFAVRERGERPYCMTCHLKTGGDVPCGVGEILFNAAFTHFIGICSGPLPKFIAVYRNVLPIRDPIQVLHANQRTREWLRQRLQPKIINLRVPLSNSMEAEVRLFLPPSIDSSRPRKYPLVINVYAGPNSYQVRDNFKIDWSLYLTTNKSIIYGLIDGRGTKRKGTDMLYATYRTLGLFEMQDQITVTRYLSNSFPFIDKNRIGIWGWSYGGYATTKILEADVGGVFKCGAAVAPVTDWIYYNSIYTERYMDLPSANPEGYRNSSTLYNVENLRNKEYLLIHGTADDNVHYQHAMHLVRVLEEKNIHFLQEAYPDGRHDMDPLQLRLFYAIDRFWDKCFGPRP